MNEKFIPHPNLSDDINLKIMQSEKDGGLSLEDVPIGKSFNVQTKHTLYHFTKIEINEYEVSGHAKYCPEPTPCVISGSTWGGSMLKLNFIGVGMYLEFGICGKWILSSEIQSVELV